MGKYLIAKEAQEDLLAIKRYTRTHWGVAQSDKYLAELLNVFSLLAQHPEIGRPVLFNDALFRFPHQSHIAYFLKNSAEITFVAVIHKSQSPQENPTLSLHEPDAVFTL